MKKFEYKEGGTLERVMVGGMLILVAFLFSRPEVSNNWRIGLALLGLAALASRLVVSTSGQAVSRTVKNIFFAWLGFVAVTVVASALGATFAVAALELVRGFLLPAIIPFLLFAYFRDQRRFGRLFMAVIATVALAMGRNLFQYFSEWQSSGMLLPNIHLHRPYSDALIFGLPFLIGAGIYFKGRRVVAAGSLILTIVALLMVALTGARGAWLAAAAIILLYLVIYRDRRLTIAAMAALGVIVLGMFTFIPAEIGMNRINQGLDTSLRTTGTWGPALEMIGDRPLLGYGYGGKVFHQEFNRRAPESPHWSIRQSMGPHSLFLDVAFSTGGIGFAILMYVFFAPVVMMCRLLLFLDRHHDRRSPLYTTGVVLLAVFGGFILTQGMVEGRSWPPIAVWLGLSLIWIQLVTDFIDNLNLPRAGEPHAE